MTDDIYKTLTERVDREFYVDTYGNVVKYKPYFEPVTVTLSDGCTFTDKDDDSRPYSITSIHSEILRQVVGNERYYCGPKINTDYLEVDKGWIAVGKVCYTHPIAYKKPTQAQIDTMFDLGYIHVHEDVFYNTHKPYWEFKKW